MACALGTMKILVDARTVRRGRTGVGYYTESMVRALGTGAEGHEVAALVLEGEEIDLPASVRLIRTRADYERHPAGEWFENSEVPRMLKREGVQLFWGPAFLIPWVKTGARRVATIHDLTVFTHPECYPRKFGAYMRFVIRMAARRADGIVCDSDVVRAEVEARFTPRCPMATVHAAADDFFCMTNGTGTEGAAETATRTKPYLLAVGAGDPRKNTELLVRAYERFPEPVRKACELVLVGKWDGGVPEGVVVLPRQERPALRELYRRALLFVNPSLQEGFGIPALEAMRCGCPVALAKSAALKDVVGEAAELFDGSDPAAVAQALVKLIESSARLKELRAAGLLHAQSFSWERSAQRLVQFFKTLVKDGRAS